MRFKFYKYILQLNVYKWLKTMKWVVLSAWNTHKVKLMVQELNEMYEYCESLFVIV